MTVEIECCVSGVGLGDCVDRFEAALLIGRKKSSNVVLLLPLQSKVSFSSSFTKLNSNKSQKITYKQTITLTLLYLRRENMPQAIAEL